MARNTPVSLNRHFVDFIDSQVASGRYSSASDVVSAGLSLLEEQEAKLNALRAALIEGEESGFAAEFDLDDFLRERRDEPR